MPGPIHIGNDNAEVEGSTASVKSPELATHLIQNHEEAMGVLGQIAPVNAKEISVDQHGRVVVANSAFAASLQRKIAAGAADDNHGCGAGCARPDLGEATNVERQ